MKRKRIAEKEPAISAEGASASPAKTPAKHPSPQAKKARDPRASANAVTHRHKNATIEPPSAAVIQQEEIVSPAAAEVQPPAPVHDAPVAASAPPSYEEIASLAYSLWESRGYQGGSPVEDWLTAERTLWNRRSGQ